GFRLSRGSRALETEVHVHNTGTTSQECWPVWRATVPWSDSLQTIPMAAAPLHSTGSSPGPFAIRDRGSENGSPVPESLEPVKLEWSGVYDEERDAGFILVGNSGRMSPPLLGVPHTLLQPDAATQLSIGQTCVPLVFVPIAGSHVAPGEWVSWNDTWVPFAGIGCPCAVDSPVLVSLSPAPEPPAATHQPMDAAAFDFGEPDENAAEVETCTIAVTAWKPTPPVHIGLEQNKELIWSDLLALSPGKVERLTVSLSPEWDHSMSLVPERPNHEGDGDDPRDVEHLQAEMLSFSTEIVPPPAHLERLLQVHESRAAKGLRDAIDPSEVAAIFGSVLALYHYGLQSLEHGQEEEALTWFRRAAECPPGMEVPCSVRDGEAIAAAQYALPSHGSPNYYCGLWLLVRGDIELAHECLERAFQSGSPWSEHPPLLSALSKCLWRSSLPGSETAPEGAMDNSTRAVMLLDRAMAADREDVDLLLERDTVGELLSEAAAERLTRLEVAPLSVRSINDVAKRTTLLLLQVGDFDRAIELLELHSAAGTAQELLRLRRDAHLGRALRLMVQWDMEPALEDIERALDSTSPFGPGGKSSHPQAELLWWAGLCCYRMGRNFHAQGYWQGVAAARAPSASIHAFCKALATGALGGTSQSLGLLEAIRELTASDEAWDSAGDIFSSNPFSEQFLPQPDSPSAAPSEAALSSALALYVLGDTRAAEMRLELLATESPANLRVEWYRQAAAAGLLERI
nr:tetratricopeptide repeat protein [Armatimonadota bacterium]